MDRLIKSLILGVLFLMFSSTDSYAQSSLSGVIVSEEGEPLAGASIMIMETGQGRSTDSNGRFSFSQIPAGTYTLRIRYIGFESQEITIQLSDEPSRLTITMVEYAIQLQGLVVTAQKRPQAIQEVPVSITAYSGEFLSQIGIEELDAFSAFVPGVEIQIQSPNNPGFVVRGITSDSGDSRTEPRVSVFQDGVSISKSRGSVVELFDMERVEVLKGPQGTLFGRGAQIGAVHLIQNKPTNSLSGELTLGPGNFDARYARGFFNAPIIDNTLMVRIAGIYNVQQGYIRNLSGGYLNGKETLALRGSVRYIPSNNTVMDLIVNYQYDNPPGTSFKSGTFSPRGGNTSPFTFADMERGEELGVERTVYGATFLVDHVLSDRFSLSSTTAFREFDSFELFDADGTAAPALTFGEDAFGQQFSQEFRLNYNDRNRFRGFAGVSYFWEDGYQRVPFETDERSLFAVFTPLLINAGFPVPFVPLVSFGEPFYPFQNNPLIQDATVPFKQFHTEEYTNFGTLSAFDIFADGTYDLSSRFAVTAGLRFTYEDMTGAYEVIDAETPGTLGMILDVFPNNIFEPTNGKISESETFTSVVGRLAVNYLLEEQTNVYASVSRGRRPAVINATARGTNILKNEIVWSYETGIRGVIMNNQMQYDLNLFYYDYSNYQTSVLELTEQGFINETRDSGFSTAYGFETSAQYAFSSNFSVFGNYSYINATFDDKDVDGNEQELAGNRFRLTPEHTIAAALNFDWGNNRIGSFYVRPNVTWKSDFFFEDDNDPNLVQNAYALVNMRMGYVFPNQRFEIMGYVRNLLNEEYLIDAGNTGNTFLIPTFIAGPPRMMGVHFTARF